MHSQLHDHHHLRLVVVSPQTLDQFGMVQVVHQLDLFTSGLPLLRSSTFVELPGTDSPRLFVGEFKHLPELTPEEETTVIFFNTFFLKLVQSF